MVGDDEVDAEFFGAACRGGGGDAAIDGDDDFGAGFCEGLDRVVVEPVALVEAVGDVGVDIGVGGDGIEHVVEDRRCGDAVDIVIAEDGDGLVVFEGGEDALGGFVEVGDLGGVVESGKGRVEECVRGGLVVEGAGGHDPGDEALGCWGAGGDPGAIPDACEASGCGLLELGGH